MTGVDPDLVQPVGAIQVGGTLTDRTPDSTNRSNTARTPPRA
ncbi:hypothetical protein ABZU75_02760 [Streptosporangium sp. NPDC005286]